MSVERRTEAFEKGFSAHGYKMFVAETPESGIVGFADLGEARENFGFAGELFAIYILPEFQRQGIGERLFTLGKDFLTGSGLNSMHLRALEVSHYKTFYEKMGGRIVGRKTVDIEGVQFNALVYAWDEL